MAEGTPVFAEEPLLKGITLLIEVQVIETLTMNVVGLLTLLASKAARMDAAVARAHALHFGGVAATSNLSAGVIPNPGGRDSRKGFPDAEPI